MRKSILLISLFYSVSSFSQFHLASFHSDVSSVLKKVLEDFPAHFNNIRGEIIGTDIQATNYSCTINIEGADSSIIIQNGDGKDNIFSWKQVVFETDDFNAAKSKFHEYCNRIKGTSAVVNNNKVTYEADYETPDEGDRFTDILFSGHPKIEQLKNVVIDLSLQYVLSGWQISIDIYEHTDYGVDQN